MHMAFCIQFIYTYVIQHFGDILYLERIDWTAGLTVVTGALVAAPVHRSSLLLLPQAILTSTLSYYVKRVMIMSNRNLILSSAIAVLAVLKFGFGIWSAYLSYRYDHWNDFRYDKLCNTIVTIGISISAAVDCVAAGSLVYFLERGRTGINRGSDNQINMLVRYFVNTGVVTMIVSVSALITYLALPRSLIFAAFIEIQIKFYANSFLAILNARKHIRTAFEEHPTLPTIQFQSVGVRPGTMFQNNPPLSLERTNTIREWEPMVHLSPDLTPSRGHGRKEDDGSVMCN
ncbi:hypothetical protein JAAARDRAFT_191396 [Jaapia argillacea MUCL 33604]|uniref:DUF6534 domain-containing protein n=1 Tax=Jaapia argillacea MUCL 33604 TaxID=933084 RepID=A0A067Q2T9_9AGAM|nr:hypothetical protein JAAARDRAFT_191396 [Jaapia argillacea MUCL 33604]